SNVFKWVFIPWFQAELDVYVDSIDTAKRQAQTHKILPHGPPDDIDENAHRYNALNFKVSFFLDLIEAERLYAPPDHPVFELVSPEFDYWARSYYIQFGSPTVTGDNVWN
ncbi:hypothetical protein K435DRAFT_569504, partial [Dendrothele bispora CBS 962.96]